MTINENATKKPFWKGRTFIAFAITGVAGILVGSLIGGGGAEPDEKGPTYFADQAPAPSVTVTAEPEPAVTVTAEPVGGGTPASCLEFIEDAEAMRAASVETIDAAAYVIGDIMPLAIEAAALWDDVALDALTSDLEDQTSRIVAAQDMIPLDYDTNLSACKAGK